MPFQRAQFLGASLRGFSSSVGWGPAQQSQLQVELVEDPSNADLFAPPPVGAPVSFQLGDFSFAGLLQRYEHKRGLDGIVYDVTLVDPREVLDGAQVILGGYAGPVTVDGAYGYNVLNVYGLWEAQGYGTSLVNEGGMPWARLRDGLLTLVNRPDYTDYGGPLSYKGTKYSLDLSQLPPPPDDYRIPGSSVTLLDLIAQLCDDGGADFFVDLVGYTIRVRTVSRRTQPPLGTITNFVESRPGGFVRSSVGLEARNEPTTTFLAGGEVTDLVVASGLRSFWGHDAAGAPILGVPYTLRIFQNVAGVNGSPTGSLLYEGPAESVALNATSVADIVGAVSYPADTLEMRLALASFESWAAYMVHMNAERARQIGVNSPYRQMGALGLVLRYNLTNDTAETARAMAQVAYRTDRHAREMRVYELVKGAAQEYLGRKFLVPLPQVQFRQDPETLRVQTDWEITDAGYLPQGGTPLNLSELNQDLFRTADGRFRCFVRYDDLGNVDFSKVPSAGSAVQNGALFVEAHADPNFVYAGGAVYALVTVNGPLCEKAQDITGDIRVVAAVLQSTPEQAKLVLDQPQYGNVGVKAHPDFKRPAVGAVPARSNTQTYGPWVATGAPGKARYEQDPSLVPWNYGGFANLNVAALARVVPSLTAMTAAETATLEMPGVPTCSLGDTLQLGGPNVTNIQVRYSPQGVTTSYSFSTFSPRFGVFTKGQAEKTKRLALADEQLRRAVRQSLRKGAAVAQTFLEAGRAQAAFLEDAAAFARRKTPHDVFIAQSVRDGSAVRVGASAATMEEAVAFCRADDDAEFSHNAVMAVTGLVRPFDTAGSGGGLLPGYVTPASGFSAYQGLDPFVSGNDVEAYAWGDAYEGLHAQRRGGPPGARPLALRAPLVLAGWGEDWEGAPFPSDGSGALRGDALTRSDLWRAGPYDAVFDARRGVWTSHDVLHGVVGSTSASGVTVQVHNQASGTPWQLSCRTWGTAPASGDRVLCYFDALDRAWYTAGPGSGTSPSPGPTGGSAVFETIYLGGSGVGTRPGSLGLGNPAASGYLVFQALPRATDYTLLWPNYEPASGDVPYFTDGTATSRNMGWFSLPYVGGYWKLPQAYLGGTGVAVPGYLGLGTPSSPGYFQQRAAPRPADYVLTWPGGAPTVGQVPPLASGDSTAGWFTWASPPVVLNGGLTLGGTGDATLGRLGLGTSGSPGYLYLEAQGRSTDYAVVFPSGLAAPGDLLRVTSGDSSTAYLGYYPTTNFAGTGSNTFLGTQTVSQTGLGSSLSPGLVLSNPTPAALGSPQYSPALVLAGSAYATGTALSQEVDFGLAAVPQQGNLGGGALGFFTQLAGGGYTLAASLSASGTFSAADYVGVGSGLTQLSASNMTLGTLPTGVLPAEVPVVGVAGAFTQLVHYQKSYADFSTAGTSRTIILATFAARGMVLWSMLKASASFEGTGINAYTISVGSDAAVNGTTNSLLPATSVHGTPGDGRLQAAATSNGNGGVFNYAATTNLTATATSTGANLSVANSGVVDVWVIVGKLP